ncbi:MAG: LPS-assembly protein LptD, partial [Spirochaetaceae bacterium]|nr:LPS-assembly protein LptD [Spirochaetaceae bacterium]
MRKAGLFLLICLPLAVFAQEAEQGSPEQGPVEQGPSEAAESGEPDKPRGLTPEFILDRDLATSSLPELADWCRSLGLSGEGSREELVSRLRDYYKPTESAGEAAETVPEDAVPETAPEAEASGEEPDSAQKRELIITIESAQATEYFTVESVHEEYARLRGGVSVSLQDGEIIHRIEAEEILYNRTRKIMTASGGVVYIKEDGDKIETFRGDGITVNLDNWSTAFMKGISDHEISEGVSTYRFEGEVVSRNGENSTVLRRSKITNPKEPEAFWSIDASKLWLLPGSDWAILNAVVKVGEIPVLWIPAFYYPANEIIFHPVLGIRTREGSFVQTTTYILGRPKALPLAEESSITAIMGSGEGMEKVREGVFLRSTGRRARDENEIKLSLLADAYVNLGYYLGTELAVPAKGYFGDLNFSGGMAWSRDIAYDYGNYTPFYPKYDGTSSWQGSYFFDGKVPFRYRFVSTGSVGGSGTVANSANLSWNLPLYSDPYMDNDFMRRSEDSSFFSLLQNSTKPDMTINTDSISSYIWSLDGNLSFVTAGLSPYINELTLTSVSMAVSFETRNIPHPGSLLSYPPDLSFFYPNKFTLFSVSASIGGMPLVLGESTDPARAEDAYIEGWGKAVSPWAEPENPGGAEEDALRLHPPALTRTINAPLLGGQRFALDYRLTPSAASEIKFNSNGVDSSAQDVSWKGPGDIDWGDMAYQLYTVRADATVGLTLSEKRDIYTNTLRFYGVSSWQDYSYMNEQASEFEDAPKREAAMRQVHNMTYFSSSAEYGFTLRPFYQSDVWKTTNFRYSVKGLLVKSGYDSIQDSWDVVRGKWNREDIEFHQVQANFNASVMDKMQTLSLTTDIPPEENALAGDATTRIWISETNARTRIRKPFDDPYYEP